MFQVLWASIRKGLLPGFYGIQWNVSQNYLIEKFDILNNLHISENSLSRSEILLSKENWPKSNWQVQQLNEGS